MVKFRYLVDAVYILENSKAQRVKVGWTMMTTSNVMTRLEDVNNIWRGKKATCQICAGRRFINIAGLVPQHVVSGISCPGANELPFEKDVAIAESYLEKIQKEKNIDTRIINNLKRRIEKYRRYDRPNGEWQFRVIFYGCGEGVEKFSHKILEQYLDKRAPLGEVFCCSVSVATEAVETVLSQMGLLESVRKEMA